MPTIFATDQPETKPKPQPAPQQPEPAPPTPQPIPHSNNHATESVNKLIHGKHNSMGLFAAYSVHPKGVHFTSQEPDEIILLFVRRHFITNVPWLLTTVFLLLIPPVLLLLISLFPSLNIPGGLLFVLIAFYFLIAIGYAFGKFISWFYNIGVVTQKRIVDLDSHNILAHNTATANFNEIVDVKFHQHGFFQSTFDYGNIHIQTEAIHANFEFDACPKPTEVSDIISDLRVAQKGHHGNS